VHRAHAGGPLLSSPSCRRSVPFPVFFPESRRNFFFPFRHFIYLFPFRGGLYNRDVAGLIPPSRAAASTRCFSRLDSPPPFLFALSSHSRDDEQILNDGGRFRRLPDDIPLLHGSPPLYISRLFFFLVTQIVGGGLPTLFTIPPPPRTVR